jgi:hypothetical protein
LRSHLQTSLLHIQDIYTTQIAGNQRTSNAKKQKTRQKKRRNKDKKASIALEREIEKRKSREL